MVSKFHTIQIWTLTGLGIKDLFEQFRQIASCRSGKNWGRADVKLWHLKSNEIL